ncbi:hypothetical protein GDO81_014786 [Engystomops pustulosus]|uniref:Uncharacterized protein n=1 Tax=Engystomops pustulosus TaxID=76066 RepID=A0AAV7AEW5_ENGPU|nr:hypothetical protein GDO81_014786 [Engystomops pustulosus]
MRLEFKSCWTRKTHCHSSVISGAQSPRRQEPRRQYACPQHLWDPRDADVLCSPPKDCTVSGSRFLMDLYR